MWTDEDDVGCSEAPSFDSDANNDSGPATASAAIIGDPEVWMDYYSEELLDLWYSVKDRCTSRGFAILDACQFPDFAQFCFQFSSGYPPPV